MPITDTCRFAWNSSKKAHQPEYDALIESYRDMLTARAEAVLATKLADDGPFAGFENSVLNAPPEPVVNSDVSYEQVIDVEPFYDEGVATPDAITQIEDIVPTKIDEVPKPPSKKKVTAKKVAVAKKPEVKKPTKKGKK